jgi:hypothetical protein
MPVLMELSMKQKDVDVFEKLKSQLDSLHQEMSVLGKKSPNDAVNSFKIKFINTALSQCNKLLGSKYRPFDDFEAFDPDALPSNSDVTFIISQYIECAEKFRADNIRREHSYWYWRTTDESVVRTSPPKKLENK